MRTWNSQSQQLEATNAHLEQALQKSETQTRLANQNLAEALVEKGFLLFAQRDFLTGYIFGAQALVTEPHFGEGTCPRISLCNVSTLCVQGHFRWP